MTKTLRVQTETGEATSRRKREGGGGIREAVTPCIDNIFTSNFNQELVIVGTMERLTVLARIAVILHHDKFSLNSQIIPDIL